MLKVLDPLEVRADDAACVCHHVRDHVDALLMEDLVGDRSRGAVRSLDQHPGVDPVGVALVDHAAERRRNQHVALDGDQVVGADHLGPLVLGELASLPQVTYECVRIDPPFALDRAGRVGDADHLCAELLKNARGPGADVPEALYDEGAFGRREPDLRRGLAEHVDAAASRRLLASI